IDHSIAASLQRKKGSASCPFSRESTSWQRDFCMRSGPDRPILTKNNAIFLVIHFTPPRRAKLSNFAAWQGSRRFSTGLFGIGQQTKVGWYSACWVLQRPTFPHERKDCVEIIQ